MALAYNLRDDTRGTADVRSKNYKKFTFYSPCPNSAVCTPYEVTLSQGKYIFEAWGSSGDVSNSIPGQGAYAKGTIVINKKTKIFLYIGTKTGFNSANVTFTSCQGKGGGATDARLVDGEWDDFESLKSRIFVAGGGAGSEWGCAIGGNGGFNGTTGYGCSRVDGVTNTNYYSQGGTQTSGGEAHVEWSKKNL